MTSNFDNLRIVSNDVSGHEIESAHRIEGRDNNGENHRLMPIRLHSHYITTQSYSDSTVYRIPFTSFTDAQVARLFEIYESVESVESMDTDENLSINIDVDNHIRSNSAAPHDDNAAEELRRWGISPEENRNTTNIWREYMDRITNEIQQSTNDIDLPSEFDPVKSTVSPIAFKRLCGVHKEHDKYRFRKWGPPVMKSLGITEATCSICLGDIEKWDELAITKCKHVFHKNCAKKWFCEQCIHPTCPSCRTDIR